MSVSYPKTFALIIIVLCSYHCLHAQKKLAIIGSSTSDCYGIPVYDSCYVGRLQQYYGNAIVITRLAVSGSSVYRGMPTGYVPPPERMAETPDNVHNITAAIQTHPDVILVNYPSNGYDVYTVTEAMYCLRTIKQAANNAGIPCYVTTTQPRSEPAAYSTPETRRKMAQIKDSVLNEFGTFAVNFWNDIVNPADSTIITTLGQGDGTHLNAAGHKILAGKVIAKNIFTTVLPLRITGITATVQNMQTTVVWNTTGAENVVNYAVQQSDDGIHFTSVYQVKAAALSTMEHQYSFTGTSTSGKFSYYRIAAMYADGRKEFSTILKVLQGKVSVSIEKLYLKGGDVVADILSNEKETIHLQVISNTGQVLISTTALVHAGNNTLPVNVSLLSKGFYILRMLDQHAVWQARTFVKP